MTIEFETVQVGFELTPLTVQVTRAQLVKYAGASGDFNAIHWNERTAVAVGLPGVIAHGMLTMALAGRIVTDWVRDPQSVASLSVTFTRPVPVPDDDIGATVVITAVVGAVDTEARTARVDVTAKFNEQTVLGKARSTVTLL